MNGRPTTQLEIDTIGAKYGTVPACDLAAELGCSLSRLYRQAHKLGHTQRMVCASDDQIVATLSELSPLGYSDTEVASELASRLSIGIDRHRVSVIRKRLGLPSNTKSDRHRQRVREATRRQLEAAGLDSIAQLRIEKWNQWKRDLGWPVELTIRAVQSLEMFYRHGPLTRVQLCDLLGVSSKKRTAPTSNAPGGTVLAELQRADLISRARKAIKLPSSVKLHEQSSGRTRTTGRTNRFKHIDVYLLNPGVKPNGRKASEHTQAS